MRSLLTLSFIISMVFISCTEEELAPGLEGNLVGYAFTFDEFGVPLKDHSGITVTTTGPKEYTAVTDKNGRYEFKQLPTGTYTLLFEKPGFGSMRWYSIKHLGGSATIAGFNFGLYSSRNAIFIYKIPVTKILNLLVVNDSLYAEFNFKGEIPTSMKLNVYFSENQDFTIDNAMQMVSKTLLPVKGIYGCRLNQASFNPQLPKGMEIFYRACIFNTATGISIPSMGNLRISGSSTYIDYTINKTIYPGQGDPSDQYSFKTMQ